MSNTPLTPSPNREHIPWWRIPQVVFVPALLLLGVLATSTMVVISLMNQDPVLDKEVYERELRAAQVLRGQARTDVLMVAQLANQARNYAVSLVVLGEK